MYRVFLADDEPWILQGIQSSVSWRDEGFFIVGTALNGVEAREKLLDLKPDLVFIDIRMPGMDGLSLIRSVRDELPDTLFCLVSGYTDFVYAKQGIELKVLGYIVKPVDENELLRMLRKAYEALVSRPVRHAELPPSSLCVKDYIRQHAAEKLTLPGLIKALSMSQSTIQRRINQETGESFQQYLARCRMDAARELLKNPALLVGDISRMCGYDDPLYFSRVFKALVGVSPTEYRESLSHVPEGN